MTSTTNRQWICCQIGAREHYAIPRALRKRDMCAGLITDYWAHGKFESILPTSICQSLAMRCHPDLSDVSVVGLNARFLQLEMTARIKKTTGWPLIDQRNQWFQKIASNKIRKMVKNSTRNQKPAVFSFSYAAKRIFETAKELGCPTILGQIDPGPYEVQLVQKLHERHGIAPLAMPPESYWDAWHEECRLADCIVVNSHWSKQALVKEGVSEQKIEIVPLAYQVPADVVIDSKEPPSEFSAQRPLNILYLGQVIARKGVVELIEAIDWLADRPVHWTVVGGGDSNLLEQLSQRSSITVTEQVDRATAIKYYKKADVFILPTHSDGFAITLLESAAFGLPIIASPYCGDVVRHDIDGLTISEVAGGVIAESVEALLKSPDDLRRYRVNQLNRQFRSIGDLADDLYRINERI